MSDKKIVSGGSIRTQLYTHYHGIAAYLTPWEELPVIEFFSHITKNNDGKRVIRKPKPLRDLGWTHRYTAAGPAKITHFSALMFIRRKPDLIMFEATTPGRYCMRDYKCLFHAPVSTSPNIFYLISYNLIMALISAYRTNRDLYDWYVQLIGKDGIQYSLLPHVQNEVKRLETASFDRDANLYYIRNRDPRGLDFPPNMITSPFLRDETSSGYAGNPMSLMTEIFLDGWRSKYHLAREMEPFDALCLLPPLMREGKFDEVLWLLQQRVPYTGRYIRELECCIHLMTTKGSTKPTTEFTIEFSIGKDRPLLGIPLHMTLVNVRGEDGKHPTKEEFTSTMKNGREVIEELILDLEPQDNFPILRGVSKSRLRNIISRFIYSQMTPFLRSVTSPTDILKQLLERREKSIEDLRIFVQHLKTMFEECCKIKGGSFRTIVSHAEYISSNQDSVVNSTIRTLLPNNSPGSKRRREPTDESSNKQS